MNRTLSQEQKNELRQSIKQGNFSAETAILKLVAEGYSMEEAKALIVAEIKAYKKDMFDKIDKRSDSEEKQKLLFVAIVMISMIGPIADITSPIWRITAIALCGLAGYFAVKAKPIAGVLAGVVLSFVLPIVHNFYFTGRTTYIQIELVIPMLIAALPAYLVYLIISKTVYAHVEND